MTTLLIQAAGGIVRNEKNELLMIFRRGKWDLPKGKLDEGESIETCAIREVVEETGLKDVFLGSLVGITYHEYFDAQFTKKNIRKETHWYQMCAKGDLSLHPQKEEDIEKALWCREEQVQQYLKNSYPTIIEILDKEPKL